MDWIGLVSFGGLFSPCSVCRKWAIWGFGSIYQGFRGVFWLPQGFPRVMSDSLEIDWCLRIGLSLVGRVLVVRRDLVKGRLFTRFLVIFGCYGSFPRF